MDIRAPKMAVRVTQSSPHLDQEASASQHMYLSYAFHIACQSSWFEQCIQPASSMCIYTWLQSAAVYRVRLSCVASIILAGLCAHSRIRCSELHNCLGPPCQLSTLALPSPSSQARFETRHLYSRRVPSPLGFATLHLHHVHAPT